MKILSSFMIAAFLLSAVFAIFVFNHGATYVVGGNYVLREGATLHGDLIALFAQVTVEQGARVDGDILALGSDLNAMGSVEGKITCLNFFGYTVLVPELNRLQISD
jgi:hypothetical protein